MHKRIASAPTVLQTTGGVQFRLSITGKLTLKSSQSKLGKRLPRNPFVKKSANETNGETKGSFGRPIPRPILKNRTRFEPKYIDNDKRNWICLPPPDIRQLQALAVTSAIINSDDYRSGNDKNVNFGLVTIRSYKQTIGDNPAVSVGPPIQLDWNYKEHRGVDIDAFEFKRGFARRNGLRQLAMSYYRRTTLLSNKYRISKAELDRAVKEAEKTKFRRQVTRLLLPMMIVEDALESTGRKVKRVFRKAKISKHRLQ